MPAANELISLDGTILFLKQLHDSSVQIWFEVVEDLAVNVSPRDSFTNTYIDGIFPSERIW